MVGVLVRPIPRSSGPAVCHGKVHPRNARGSAVALFPAGIVAGGQAARLRGNSAASQFRKRPDRTLKKLFRTIGYGISENRAPVLIIPRPTQNDDDVAEQHRLRFRPGEEAR